MKNVFVRSLSRKRAIVLLLLVIPVAVVSVFYISRQLAAAASGEIVPNGAVTSGWAVSTFTNIDEGSPGNTTDFISTGTSGTGGEIARYDMSTLSNVGSVSSVRMFMYARSATNANGGTLDDVNMQLFINGAAASTATVRPTTSWATYSTPIANGTWTQAQLDAAQVSMTRVVNGGGTVSSRDDNVQISAVWIAVEYSELASTEQISYRWFENADSLTPGAPLSDQDFDFTPSGGLGRVRLQILMTQTAGAMQSGAAYKLQYSPMTALGLCDPAFNGETYVDVPTTASAGGIGFYNNPSISDGATAINGGITFGGTIKLQTYDEANNLSPRSGQTLNTGEAGIWDVSLDISQATEGTYCLRLVNSNSSLLAGYGTKLPSLAIGPGIAQDGYRVYQNTDSLTPGSPLANDSEPAEVAPSTPFRVRQLIEQRGFNGNDTDLYKLQFAEKSGVCDPGFQGEVYADIDPPAGANISMIASGGESLFETDGDPWWDPLNIAAQDGSYAIAYMPPSFDGVTFSHYLRSSAHGHTIPAEATITGVQVRAVGYLDAFNFLDVRFDEVSLVKGGVRQAGNRANDTYVETFGEMDYTFGGATDMWGTSLTPADVNSSSFGVDIRLANYDAQPVDVGIDAVYIRVYYDLDGEGGLITYNQNPGVADNAAISSTANDPSFGGTVVNQQYIETFRFGHQTALNAGQAGLWDHSLTSAAATEGKTYCIRVVRSNGLILSDYEHIIEISFVQPVEETVPASSRLRNGRSIINGVKSPFDL